MWWLNALNVVSIPYRGVSDGSYSHKDLFEFKESLSWNWCDGMKCREIRRRRWGESKKEEAATKSAFIRLQLISFFSDFHTLKLISLPAKQNISTNQKSEFSVVGLKFVLEWAFRKTFLLESQVSAAPEKSTSVHFFSWVPSLFKVIPVAVCTIPVYIISIYVYTFRFVCLFFSFDRHRMSFFDGICI